MNFGTKNLKFNMGIPNTHFEVPSYLNVLWEKGNHLAEFADELTTETKSNQMGKLCS